jgi:hypothetical protein
MSYPSAPPRAYQIDVVDQIGRAYRAVFEQLQLVVEIALLPYLTVLATVLIALLMPDGVFGGVLAGLIRAIGFLLFGAVFIVRWHRFVLLGETISDELIPPGWTEFVLAGVKLGAMVFAGWLVLALIAALPPHFLTVPLSGIGGVAMTLLALRVSLIFPAAAIGRPIRLRTAWEWIEGNFWRLFACSFASYFPFVIIQILISGLSLTFPSILGLFFEALRLAVAFIGAAVIAALLSHLYRDIGAGGEPG